MPQKRAIEPARWGVVDPRLLRYATRAFIGDAIGLGFITALLVIAQAWLLAYVIAGAFGAGKNLSQLRGPLAVLLAVVLARGSLGRRAPGERRCQP